MYQEIKQEIELVKLHEVASWSWGDWRSVLLVSLRSHEAISSSVYDFSGCIHSYRIAISSVVADFRPSRSCRICVVFSRLHVTQACRKRLDKSHFCSVHDNRIWAFCPS